MGLYKLFSYNVEIQYKSCLISKAMLFTLLTTALNIILPFIVAYRSRGFWLKSYSFFEQPTVHFTYEYLLVAETEDPSQPIVCAEGAIFDDDMVSSEENCAEIQIPLSFFIVYPTGPGLSQNRSSDRNFDWKKDREYLFLFSTDVVKSPFKHYLRYLSLQTIKIQEYDKTGNGRNDLIDFRFRLVVPTDHTITSLLVVLALDYQLKTVCPLQMQSLAVITKEFAIPPSGFTYFGDLHFYQTKHLPCVWNTMDTKYNKSLLNQLVNERGNVVDVLLDQYFRREVTTQAKTMYSRSQNGHTGTMDVKINLRLPEMEILYTPSTMQEFKWAWPQYLSLVIIFYWILERVKRFVFHKRLLMAWEVVPWKK